MKAESIAQRLLSKPVDNDDIFRSGTTVENIFTDLFSKFESKIDIHELQCSFADTCMQWEKIVENTRNALDIEYSNFVIKELKNSKYQAPVGSNENEKIRYYGHSSHDREDLELNHKKGFKQILYNKVCSVPSEYRLEDIAQFGNITLENAEKLARAYCDFNFSFNIVKVCNQLIQKRISPTSKMRRSSIGCQAYGTLLGYYEDLQKTCPMPPKRGTQVIGEFGHDINGYVIFTGTPEEIEEEKNPLEREPQLITYSHRIGLKINPSYKGKKTLKAQRQLLSLIWSDKFKKSDLIRNKKLVNSFTPAQKLEVKRAIQESIVRQLA